MMPPEITKDVLEQVKFVLKARDVVIVSKFNPEIAMPMRWLVVRFKNRKVRSARMPLWMNLQETREWFYRIVEELYPKKPRPGAARRKMQPSIKSKVVSGPSELWLKLNALPF